MSELIGGVSKRDSGGCILFNEPIVVFRRAPWLCVTGACCHYDVTMMSLLHCHGYNSCDNDPLKLHTFIRFYPDESKTDRTYCFLHGWC